MARFSRRRSRRRSTRRKSRRAPRRRMAKKFSRRSRRLNRHRFVRSTETVVYNDVTSFASCVSSDVGIIPVPGVMAGVFDPYEGLAGVQSASSFQSHMVFRLGNTDGYQDFTSLYDQYKIDAVRVTFEYAHDTATADGSSVPLPKLYAMRDWDDSTALSASDCLQSSTRVMRFDLRRPRSFLIKPKFKQYIMIAPSTSGPDNVGKTGWIDCANPNVLHYGLKFGLIDWPTHNAVGGFQARPLLRVRCDYFISCRNVR